MGGSNLAKDYAKTRATRWALGVIGIPGIFFLIFIILAASITYFLGSSSAFAGGVVAGNKTAITTEWENQASIATGGQLPNAVALAFLQATSGGNVFWVKNDCNGKWLTTCPSGTTPSNSVAGLLGQATANQPGGFSAKSQLAALPKPQSNYQALVQNFIKSNAYLSSTTNSAALESNIKGYLTSPYLSAWALDPVKNNKWQFSGSTQVLAAATAPYGQPLSLKWGSSTLTGNDTVPPAAMWVQAGKNHYQMSYGVTRSTSTAAFPGQAIWSTTAQIPAGSKATVWAQWNTSTGVVYVSVPLVPNAAQTVNGSGNTPSNPVSVFKKSGWPAIQFWMSDIEKIATQLHMPPDVIAAEMLIESGGNPKAGSLSGAFGLMQLEPGAGQISPPVPRTNDYGNILRGATYINNLHTYYGSWRLAFSAYYAGVGTVDSHITKGQTWSQAQSSLGVVPFPQYGNTMTVTNYANSVWAAKKYLDPSITSYQQKQTQKG